MPRHKHVERLLAKAAQDEYVVHRLLPDDEAPVEAFGFHAQQAAEKLLKAVLVAAGARYPRTHRLAELIDLLRATGVEVPVEFDDLRHLTPFAVEFRYDITPDEDETPLDKKMVCDSLQELRAWVGATVAQLMPSER